MTPRKKWAADKSGCDIAVLIFVPPIRRPASVPIPGATSFILHCHNKNNRPMKRPPRGLDLVGGGVSNVFEKEKESAHLLCVLSFVLL